VIIELDRDRLDFATVKTYLDNDVPTFEVPQLLHQSTAAPHTLDEHCYVADPAKAAALDEMQGA